MTEHAAPPGRPGRGGRGTGPAPALALSASRPAGRDREAAAAALWGGIDEADSLPPGPPRSRLLEEVLAAATTEGLDDVAVAARAALTLAALRAGEPLRAVQTFTTLGDLLDAPPPWFGPWERHQALWAHRWVTWPLLEHPEVPLTVVDEGIAAMERRYAIVGEGPEPVLRARYELVAHRDGHHAAHEAYLEWVASGTTPLTDCEACLPAVRARHLAAVGLPAEAAQEADEALAATCDLQPADAIGALLVPLLLTGQGARAATEHVRGVHLAHGRPGAAGRDDHLLALARAGRTDRALDLVEAWLPWAAREAAPLTRLRVGAAVCRVLRGLAEGGHAATVVRTGPAYGGDLTVDDLGPRLARDVRDLAARFDRRNGTPTWSMLVQEVLDAGPLPDLPLDALTRSPRYARVATAAPVGPAGTAAGPGGPDGAGGQAGPAGAPGQRRGRRAARADVEGLAREGAVTALAAEVDAALAAESAPRRDAALAAWAAHRERLLGQAGAAAGPGADPADAAAALATARLEGWLALLSLHDPGTATDDALTAAADAAQRLRSVAGPVEALLHEQACVLAAATTDRVAATVAVEQTTEIAAEVSGLGTPLDAGLAWARVVEAAALADPGRGDRTVVADAARRALAGLESAPAHSLGHQHRRALSRTLRAAAEDTAADIARPLLERAVDVLPDGVRPLERALARADLATVLQHADRDGALGQWAAAADDAARAEVPSLLGSLLATAAGLRAADGEHERAAEELLRAVPLLDAFGEAVLAAQARVDLARSLLAAGRRHEAWASAEAALADLTDDLAAEGIRLLDGDATDDGAADGGDVWAAWAAPGGPSAADGPSGPDEPPALDRVDVHLAGCAAFTAAEAADAAGHPVPARAFAVCSAGWHRRNGNRLAESEAWQLAARTGGHPATVAEDLQRAAALAEAAGDWARAATCRRERVTAVQQAHGLEAAFAALEDARAEVGRHADKAAASDPGRPTVDRQVAWHRVALDEQRVRLLALAGRFLEADDLVEPLEQAYRELGDAWSARDVLGLRGQVRAELGDLAAAEADLRGAAEEAARAGDAAQAEGLAARLATVLDAAGRTAEAEAVWERYGAG